MTATVSLCMIVRDAEHTLGDALDSVRDYVDELIIVDTGSLDRTCQIARDRGADVSFFPWCDDFSAARNDSLAKATGDWIFWIDADDVLVEGGGPVLRELIAEHPMKDAAFWVMVEQSGAGTAGTQRITRHGHLKLFPRRDEFQFQYRVHEQIAPSLSRAGIPFKSSPIVIRHQGVSSPAAQARRLERNLRLLKLDLQGHPDDPFVHFNIALTHLGETGDARLALEHATRALEGYRDGSPMRVSVWHVLATAQRQLDRHDAEMESVTRAVREFPDEASLLLRLGGRYARRQRWSDAADCYRRVLDHGRQRGSVHHAPNPQRRALRELGRMHVQLGDITAAEQCWRKYLQLVPDDHDIQTELQSLLLRPHSFLAVRPRPDEPQQRGD